MANEINLVVQLQLAQTSGTLKKQFIPGAQQITQTEVSAYENTVSVTTSDTKLTSTGIASQGLAYFSNVSGSGTILVGADSTAVIRPFASLKPGESYVIRTCTGSTYRTQLLSTVSATLSWGIFGD